MEFKVNLRFASGGFCIPFIGVLNVETSSIDDVYCNLDNLTISIWGLDGDNFHVIFVLHNKVFEVGFAGDGRFDPCVICGIVLLV